MSEEWAERQRHTNHLARRLAGHIFSKQEVTAQQLYGFSRLAWVTSSDRGEAATYVNSTKIPALADVMGVDFSSLTLRQVASQIAQSLDDDPLYDLVLGDSGFTNFYNSYRNSVLTWINDNFSALAPLYKSAYSAKNDNTRLKIIEAIADIPGIPQANRPDVKMRPEFFLTPAFFVLDPEIRFPLINGNRSVRKLLKELNVLNSGLLSQYKAMASLYGTGGIVDAADLDQVGGDLPDFLSTNDRPATKKLLEKKDVQDNRALPLKDESDIDVLNKAGTISQRRIHNQLTNKLIETLKIFTLLEGRNDCCMFDALVKNYDGKNNDLLIEVKSSVETPQVRMAIGQLFNYWYALKGCEDQHLAVLLPERPNKKISEFLKWLDIGLIWFESNRIRTEDEWIEKTLLRIT